MKYLLFILLLISNVIMANDIDRLLQKKADLGDFEAVDKLLEKGANPNARSHGWARTLVADLIINNHFEMADHIINKGGKIIPRKGENLMLLSLNKWKKDSQCKNILATIKYLKNKGFKIENAYTMNSTFGFKDDNLLHKLALRKGESCLELTEYALNNGGEKLLNQFSHSMFGQDKTSYTPFLTALIKWNYDVAMLFVEYNLDLKATHYINPERTGYKKYTALMLTARFGNLEIAKELIKLGANDFESAKNVKARHGEGKDVIEHLIIMH